LQFVLQFEYMVKLKPPSSLNNPKPLIQLINPKPTHLPNLNLHRNTLFQETSGKPKGQVFDL
jgi:hypothetical protein